MEFEQESTDEINEALDANEVITFSSLVTKEDIEAGVEELVGKKISWTSHAYCLAPDDDSYWESATMFCAALSILSTNATVYKKKKLITFYGPFLHQEIEVQDGKHAVLVAATKLKDVCQLMMTMSS